MKTAQFLPSYHLLQGEYGEELWTDDLLVLTVYKPNFGFDLFLKIVHLHGSRTPEAGTRSGAALFCVKWAPAVRRLTQGFHILSHAG